MAATGTPVIQGHISRGFEAVRDAFKENFGAVTSWAAPAVSITAVKRSSTSGRCSEQGDGRALGARHDGCRPLGNQGLGGDDARNRPLARLAGLRGAGRNVPAAFGQHGKEKITVRQLLAHQAGLFAFDEPVDQSVVANLDQLAAVMERHEPAWEPGTRQAYHGLTLGFYEGELMRRVDPRHRSLGSGSSLDYVEGGTFTSFIR